MSGYEQILSVEHLSISFETQEAVKDVSFDILKGEVLAVVGESGSGKSLTALSLMGLLPKNAGLRGKIRLYSSDASIELNNKLSNANWQNIRGGKIGMVFQEPMSSLNPVMTIGTQLREAILAHQSISQQEAKLSALEWLGKVQLQQPEKLYGRYPHELSGGQKQRVMIAMAMCNHPVLLIADEPTTALDVTVQQEIIRLMKYLQEEYRMAMLFITHDLSLAATIADKVSVMYKGEMVEYGDADTVLKHPQHAYTKALLASKPSAEHKGQKLPIVADFLDGKEHVTEYLKTDISEDVLLRVNDLKVWFAEETNLLGVAKKYFKAVDGVSFELRKGEVLGLVGESGCGKSTIGKSILGLLPVYSGQIIFEREDITALAPKDWKHVRRKMQMIFQDPYGSLNPRMTIGDAIAEPMQVHSIVPASELQAEVKRLLDLVHLPADSYQRYPHQFSGGQRQRIGIARALALRPELLICDESVSALDVSVQAQILNLLKELQEEFGLTYLFISHDLNVVHYISDRVMVMHAGKIVERGDAEQVLKQPKDAYTKRLIDAMPKMMQ